jgi:hypothetical protein
MKKKIYGYYIIIIIIIEINKQKLGENIQIIEMNA